MYAAGYNDQTFFNEDGFLHPNILPEQVFETTEEFVAWINRNVDEHGCTFHCPGEISTVKELGEMLDLECFSNLWKDRYGSRPRGYSVEEARKWLLDVPELEEEPDYGL